MRRALFLASVVVALVGAASPVLAAPGQSFHFALSGRGAEGGWSTYPTDGSVVTNVVYRDTYIGTATQASRTDGTRANGTSLFVDVFSYKFDRRGNFVPVSEVFGFIEGSSLAIDNKLLGATASGSGAADVCQIDADWNYTCVQGTVSVSASWTGQGPLTRSHGSSSFGVSGEFQSTFHGTFLSRAATATATVQVNESSVDIGPNWGADMFSFSNGENDVFICRSGC